MPTITLNDGSRLYVENTDKKTIEEAIKRHKKALAPDVTPIGDIGRGIGRGLVSIPQGITELGTTGIDLIFDTDITDDVTEYFEQLKPEVSGGAGKTAQFITQFGIPGLGTASLLSKLGKTKAILGAAAVDGAVATDDVETIQDVFFDSESDEDRLARLEGADAAAARLMDRLGVVGETAAIMFTAPLAISGTVALAGKGADLAAPLLSPVAKALSKAPEGEVNKSAREANSFIGNFLRDNFTFAGRKPNQLVAQATAAKTAQLQALQEEVETVFTSVRKTLGEAVGAGNINQKDASKLSQNIQDYMFPLVKVSYRNPELRADAAAKAAKELQQKALNNIKSFEGPGRKIDYEALGIDESLHVSKLLQNNRNLLNLQSREVLDMSAKGDDALARLLIPKDIRTAIERNDGLYGVRAYKAMTDKAYVVDPKEREKAIRAIQTKLSVSRTQAEDAFSKLENPGPKNKTTYSFETPKLLTEGMQFGVLQGRKLNNLPEVRKALGEITGYGQKDWKKALDNTAMAASLTMTKLGSLVAKGKMFDEIKFLNDNAASYGGQKFLREFPDAPKELGADGETLARFVDVDGIRYKKFGKDAGVLKDQYAPEIFHDAIMGATTDFLADAPILMRNFLKGAFALKSGTQYGKTILSPTTQVRNFTSVPFFALMNGNLGPSGRFAEAVSTVFAGLFDPRKRALKKEVVKEARDYGIIQRGGAVLDEIKALGRYATEDSKLADQLLRSDIAKQTRKYSGIDTFERAYSMSDDTARMFNWNAEQTKLANVISKSGDEYIPVTSAKNVKEFNDAIELVNGSPSIKASALKGDALDRFIKGEAAEITLNTVPTYSRVPDAVRQLKYVPFIGNFIAFPSEIIRNTSNTLARSIKELASGNTELQKIGARRLMGGLTTTIGLPYGITKAAIGLTGANQEQIDAYQRSFAAPWDKSATLIPVGTDDQGNVTSFLNFSYTNPYDYLQRPFKAVMMEVTKGNLDERSLMDIATRSMSSSFQELFSPFYEPSIGFQTLLDTYTGQTQTGREVYKPTDNFGEKMAKSFTYIVDEISPTITPFNIGVDAGSGLPFGVRITQKDFPRAFTSSVFGSTDLKGDDALISSKGRRIDVPETMVQAFSGLKVVKPQIDRSLRYKGFAANEAIKDSTNEFNRILRAADSRTAEEYVRAYISTNEDRYNALRDLYTAIEDARLLGVRDYEINRELKAAKVASRDLVMQGIFMPQKLSPELITYALSSDYNKARQPVPISQITKVGAEIAGQSLMGRFVQPPSPGITSAPSSDILREEEIRKLLGTP